MRRLLLGLFLLAGTAMAAPPHYGGIPAYLTLEGIPGSVNVAGREGTIEVGDVDWQVYIPTDRDDGSLTGTRKHNGFSFTKVVDKASPLLFQKLCKGETIAKATFVFYEIDDKGSENEAYKIELENLKVADITSYNPEMFEVLEGSRVKLKDNGSPSEKVTLRYSKVTFTVLDGDLKHSDEWNSR